MNYIMVWYKGYTGWFHENDTEGIKEWKRSIDNA